MSEQHVSALLSEYKLGMLDAREEAQVTAHLAACAECRAEAVLLEEAAGLFGAYALPPVSPSGEARLRLMQAIRPVQPVRNLDRADQVAKFFDLPSSEARALLEKAANPAAWEAAPWPGLYLMHLVAGPKFAGADAGLVRFDGGSTFPVHAHDGDEHTLMIEGVVTFTDGRRLEAGGYELMQPGREHGFTVDAEGCIYAQMLYVGIDIPGIGKVSLKSH